MWSLVLAGLNIQMLPVLDLPGAVKWFEMRRVTQAPPEMGRSYPQVFLPVFAFRAALHSTHMAPREVSAFWLLLSSMNFTAQRFAI